MANRSSLFTWLLTLGLLALAGGLAAIFNFLGRDRSLNTHVPEFVALALLGGMLYLAAVYIVENFTLHHAALAVILGSALVLRLLALPAAPSLSEDIYRYQWEGRVQRAKLNPYTISPAMPGLAKFRDPEHPLKSGSMTSTAYPPLIERILPLIKTVSGYKKLSTALDLASIVLILVLLARLKQPPHRVLIYAWNPTVIVSFALCGHHDSLAIVTLLLADLFIICQQPALSMFSLSVSFLSKYFPALLLPVFLKRMRWGYAAIFAVVVSLAYLPYLSAGPRLFKGLSDYAAGWESNDSLFRLIRAAGNSRAQAELVAGVLILGLLGYALKKRMRLMDASLLLLTSLLLLSPNAFPWYFTWLIPFLCFSPRPPLLLMSVTAILGYSPVVAYSAGQPYRDSPVMLALEYVPAYLWLAHGACLAIKQKLV